jgi:hypothetical protein
MMQSYLPNFKRCYIVTNPVPVAPVILAAPVAGDMPQPRLAAPPLCSLSVSLIPCAPPALSTAAKIVAPGQAVVTAVGEAATVPGAIATIADD